MQRKLEALESSGWGFEARTADGSLDGDALETQIEEIESHLQNLGMDAGILGAHLAILVDVLEHARDHLWFTSISLILDRMGIKRKAKAPNSTELQLQELHGVKGGDEILLRVSIPRSEFPQRGDFLAEAQRLLG